MAIGLEESSKQYFAFETPNMGSWEMTRLPFGFANSPAFYAKFIFHLISTMPTSSCIAYVDDVLIHSKDHSGRGMLPLIDKFLTRVEESRARIQVAKTYLMASEVDYLGYLVSEGKISMTPSYRAALLEFPPPSSPSELGRFLGMVGFYRQFITNMSQIASRLHTRKFESWTKMTEQDLADFYELKKRLIQSEALGHPEFSDLAQIPFILGLDWSKEVIG